MDHQEKLRVLKAIEDLENRVPSSPMAAEQLAGEILQRVMREEGYEVEHAGRQGDGGFDFIARRPPDDRYAEHTAGIQFKYLRTPLEVARVRELIGAAYLNNLDRAILLASAGFTRGARQLLQRELPLAIELLDVPLLREWAMRLVTDESVDTDDVRAAVRILSRTLALLVARDSKKLDEIEWRDLERLLAEAFDGLGFNVVLTRPAKDGGKDLVLTCHVTGISRTYIVEVKHWVAGGKVGSGTITNFLNVIAREERAGGVLLSSSGFTSNAFEELSEIDRELLRFGEKAKIVSICRRYMKVGSGIWSPPENLAELLYEETI